MKIPALILVYILCHTGLQADSRDIRFVLMQQLVSELDSKKFPRIVIVKEVCQVSKTYLRFSGQDLQSIIENSDFQPEQLVPVSDITFPKSHGNAYRDSHTGLGLTVISFTRIYHQEGDLLVDYIVDSGIRAPGYNLPSDGNFVVGSFRVTYDGASRHIEHLKFTNP